MRSFLRGYLPTLLVVALGLAPSLAKGDVEKQVSVGAGGQSAEFVIEQKRVWRPRRAPSAGGANY